MADRFSPFLPTNLRDLVLMRSMGNEDPFASVRRTPQLQTSMPAPPRPAPTIPQPPVPMAQPQQMQPAQAGPGPGGIAGLLQRPGMSNALMTIGAGLMAQSDSPGSFLGNLGRVLPAGVGAYQAGQEEAEAEADFRSLLSQVPESHRAIIEGLGRDRGSEVAAELLLSPDQNDYTDMQFDDRVLRVYTDGTVRVLYEKGSDQGDDISLPVREELRAMGVDPDNAPPELIAEAKANVTQQELREAVEVAAASTVDPMKAAFASAVQEDMKAVVTGAPAAETALGELRNAREMQGLLESGEIQFGIEGEVVQGLNRLRALFGDEVAQDAATAGERMILRFRTNALAFLQAFKGQISNRELAAAQFLAGDITMQPRTVQQIIDSARVLAAGRLLRHKRKVGFYTNKNPENADFFQQFDVRSDNWSTQDLEQMSTGGLADEQSSRDVLMRLEEQVEMTNEEFLARAAEIAGVS